MARTATSKQKSNGAAAAHIGDHLTDAKSEALATAEALRRAAEAAVAEARGMASGAVDHAHTAAQSAAASAREAAGDMASQAQTAGQQAAKTTRTAAKTAHSEFTKAVRDHPGMAVAGAVGLGVLLGFALRRS